MENIKKKNGEGSIFQVSENKWVAKISLGTGANGKPVIKQFTGKTEAIVKKKLKDFRKSEDFAERHMPAQDTVQAYFTRWLQEYQYNKLKPASYDRLETTVRCHILPLLVVQRWISSPETIYRDLSTGCISGRDCPILRLRKSMWL